jgi:hypothetical protein
MSLPVVDATEISQLCKYWLTVRRCNSSNSLPRAWAVDGSWIWICMRQDIRQKEVQLLLGPWGKVGHEQKQVIDIILSNAA